MNILDELYEHRRDAQHLEYDIQRLEAIQEHSPRASYREYETHGEGVPTDPTQAAAVRVVDFERELRERIDRQASRRRRLEAELNRLLSPAQAAVVKLYFLDGYSVRGAAYALYGEETDYDENEETYRWRALKMKRRAEKSLRKFPNVPQMSSNVPKCPQLEE